MMGAMKICGDEFFFTILMFDAAET